MMPHVASQHSSPTAPPVGVGAGSDDGSGLRTLACHAASADTADAAMAVTHTTATHIRERGARTIFAHGCGAHGGGVRRGGGGAGRAARLGDRLGGGRMEGDVAVEGGAGEGFYTDRGSRLPTDGESVPHLPAAAVSNRS